MKPIHAPGISLRIKIILPYVILAIALASGAAYIAARVAADSISERFDNQLIEAGKLSAESMVKAENRLLETLRLIAYADGVAAALEQADAEQLRELVYPIAVNARAEAVDLLDAQGVAILSLRHRAGNKIEDYQFSRGDTTLRAQPGVRAVLDGARDSVGNKYAGLVTAQAQTWFYVAGPIVNARGERIGAVLVAKSLHALAREIREATLAQITFYDADGRVLATTFLEAPRTGADPPDATASVSVIRDTRATNIEYGEIVGAWQARGDENLGWLGTAFAKNFIVRLSQNTWVQILLSSVLGLLLVLIAGWIIAYRITKPIVQLERAATQVAQGDLQVRVAPNGNDEVARLIAQFNAMVTNLASSKQDLIAAYDMSIAGWAKALDMRDHDTENHSVRVTELTLRLARAVGVPEHDLANIRRGALLHDIGKMAIPDHILLKPTALDDTEWAIMRQHPVYALEMIKGINFLQSVIEIPAYHHEHWDGTGYPKGLKGEQIPLAARIFAVVDVWDALCSDRPYRRALTRERACQIIADGAGTQFDAAIVVKFFQVVNCALPREDQP